MPRTQQPDNKPKLTAEALKIWRVAKHLVDPNWSQEGTAKWFGVDVRTYRRWENDEVKIPLYVVLRVLEYESMRRQINPIQTVPYP